jgi:hypothetical protein
MVVTFSFVTPSMSQINMSASGSHSQNFDALISTGKGKWISNSTIPGWYSQRTGNGDTITASTGSGNTGILASFGATGTTERALGTIGSGNAAIGNMAHGVQLRNTSGNTITDIKVSYTLEQWRCGGPTSLSQLIHGYYKTSATPIDTLHPPDTSYSTTLINNNAVYGWTQIPGLTLGSLINATTAAALDGNLPANRVGVVDIALPGLSLANNQYIMIKWDDSNHVGSDHGLALDDVTITWTVSSVAPQLSATSLTAFGNVCSGTTAGPNSFNISGVGLSNAAITVGPLSGYGFATSAAGPYTSSLSINQPGGTLATTAIYVRFSPTAAQSYNGSIPVSGGGATSITVAASGTGLASTSPTFNSISAICSGGSFSLPTTSTNAIAGTWAPAVNNTATTTYTFTPNTGVCATTAQLTVVVNQPTVPAFTQVSAICSGGTFTLPSSSTNGIAGSWSPAINNTTTTTYTFTPNAGQCATTTTMTVTVNQPGVVSQVGPDTTICSGGVVNFPTTSLNGITGTWSPAFNNAATTTYTFTPNAGQCAQGATRRVTVNPVVTTQFAAIAPICSGGTFTLPTTSTNGVTGTWSPAINNTATTTYTFTPAAGQCATTFSMMVTVNPLITPSFSAIAPICSGGTFTLPTTSINGITGTWTPAINNTTTTTYTFTPAAGQCANTTNFTVTVNPVATPTFTAIAPICSGGSFTLPTTSNNGVTGTWSPAINNAATTTYTFTPAAGQCANTATITVTVNPSTTPQFDQVAPICVGATFTLPSSSTNGVTGTWSPAVNNQATTTYTFTPAAGTCATTVTMTVEVLPNTAQVITGDSSQITTNTAILSGEIASIGCSNVTDYGVVYSGISAFNPAFGTKVAANNLTANKFSSSITGLVQNTAYYYRTYVTTSAGTVYGEQKFFATSAIASGLTIYGNPSYRGTEVHYSVSGIKPGHYAVRLINSAGQLVFQKDFIVQLNFIDDRFVFPAKLPIGLYVLQVVNPEFKIQKPMYVQ